MCTTIDMCFFTFWPQKGALFLVLLLLSNNDARQEKYSNVTAEDYEDQVAVRAVFLNCESDKDLEDSDGDVAVRRFEREEMYRHGQLQDCRKKIAFTVKLPSHPSKSGGEEYIPIEHVFDGTNKQRVRILDPYVLRIQRDAPVQAYTLQLIDTIKGVLTRNTGKVKRKEIKEKHKNQDKKRLQRDTKSESEIDNLTKTLGPVNDFVAVNITSINGHYNWSVITPKQNINPSITSSTATVDSTLQSVVGDQGDPSTRDLQRVKRHTCENNFLSWRRRKRNEHNVIIEGNTDEDNMPIWLAKDQADEQSYNRDTNVLEQTTAALLSDEQPLDTNHKGESEFYSNDETNTDNNDDINSLESEGNEVSKRSGKQKNSDIIPFNEEEKEYTMYGIREPQFWHSINVQLFEKTTDGDGKTVWNDITRGDTASVGPLHKIWKGPDLTVKYRSLEWLNRDEFTLPKKPHCLLVPVNSNSYSEKSDSEDVKDDSQYIIVPQEDILGAESILRRRNISDDYPYDIMNDPVSDEPSNEVKPSFRRVIVRVSKALLGSAHEPMDLVYKESKPYLTLLHRQKHRAQIDLEAVADNNQLVRVGEFGRLTMVVSDSTRPARAVLTVQASNTGLAAARFRVMAKNCDPELSELLNESGNKAITSGSVLVPPRHTRKIKLELPVEIPVGTVHCSVALLNHKDEAVAIRDVAIKKDDRCFCVWHCECVCLSEDPKLLCHSMSEPRLVAAGLTREDRSRRTRQAPCKDCKQCQEKKDCKDCKECQGIAWEQACDHDGLVSTMFLITGVVCGLLIMGFTKAMVGLFNREIALWGLDKVVKLPRPIPKYQEVWLKNRDVVYDEEGWPVNPDNPSHRVAFMPLLSMIYLNTTLFATLPCILMRDALKRALVCVCVNKETKPQKDDKSFSTDVKKSKGKKRKSSRGSSSTVQANVQGNSQRHRRYPVTEEPWMSPDAEQLSEDVYENLLKTDERYNDGQNAITADEVNELMQPLLIKSFGPNLHPDITSATENDSEQDDTKYVLTQMQKSRESLSKLQGKNNATPKSDQSREKSPNGRNNR